MSRNQNAKRQHLVAPYAETKPTESAYLPLSKYISDISANNDENVETEAFYHGDGTPENTVISSQKGYSVEGYRFIGDPAQDLISEMELKTLGDRKLWHKVISANGAKIYEGIATVTEIIVDGGGADEFETFSCNITYDKTPTVTTVGSTPAVEPLSARKNKEA